MPLGEVLRTRLGAVIQGHGYSWARLSADMGKGRNWLGRKLGDADDARKLSIEDCEEVLTFLELPDRMLLQPVLMGPDEEILRSCAATDDWIAVEIPIQIFKGAPASLDRLVGQGLLDRQVDQIRIAPTGALLAAGTITATRLSPPAAAT